jgi:hypothetical protein
VPLSEIHDLVFNFKFLPRTCPPALRHVQASFIAACLNRPGKPPPQRWRHEQSKRKQTMVRTIALSAALAFSLATAASAGVPAAPLGTPNSLVVKVAEGCGPGFWRGPGGRCHPFAVGRACPPGYHLGPEGKRCWPN